MSLPTRVYAQTNPLPLKLLSPLLNKMSQEGWQHEATIQVGVGQVQSGIVGPNNQPQTDVAVVVVLSGLVDDPKNYTLPSIEL